MFGIRIRRQCGSELLTILGGDTYVVVDQSITDGAGGESGPSILDVAEPVVTRSQAAKSFELSDSAFDYLTIIA